MKVVILALLLSGLVVLLWAAFTLAMGAVIVERVKDFILALPRKG